MADVIEVDGIFGDVSVQIYGEQEYPMAIFSFRRKDALDRTQSQWK